jgi:putative flippase GtrA
MTLLDISYQSITWQVTLFSLVGVINTAIDFIIYNLLTKKIARIPANICSTSIAMTFSFTANFFVFQPSTLNAPDQATKFIIVTATSLYLIQILVIYFTTSIWTRPSKTAYTLIKKFSVTKKWNESFISKNTVKLIATGCSLVWNFLWYRFYVYQ